MTETPITMELAAVRGELARVDAKCGTLSALTMAGLAFLTTQVDHGPMPVRSLMATAGVLLAAATLVLLAVIRPRLGSTGFRLYARIDPAALRHLLTDQDAAARLAEHDLVTLSGIVNRKYRALAAAVALAAAAVLTTAAAITTGLLT